MAAKTAHQLGCDAFQYFPKNPRSLALKAFDPADAERCRTYAAEHGLVSIGHSAYPVNLANPDPDARQAAVASLRNDLAIADACGSLGVVVHFGKVKPAEPLEGYRRVIGTLNLLLGDWHGSAKVLLENQAGEGGVMGTTFEEMMQIRSLTDCPGKVAFCLDTCHLFAAGIWSGANWPEVARRGSELGYFRELAAIHLNDSLYPAGERKDRHQAIGYGAIGIGALRELVCDEAVAGIPLFMETPLPANLTARADMERVRGLLAGGGTGA